MTSDQLQLISDAILSPHGIVFVMIYLTWRRFCYEAELLNNSVI